MKTANTAKIVPVVADNTAWSFTATNATLNGHEFAAQYSIAQSGDVYVFAIVQDIPVRIHVGKASPVYHACFEAAMAAKSQPKAESKPAAEPAKPVESKPAAEPAKPVDVASKSWIGTTVEGKGWRIVFDESTQRTRVIFDGEPSAKQKAAIDAAGFYWSNTTKSWNKKLTCKAYRAAMALHETLNALA